MKVHINNDGNPGECHANIGICPFGTSDEHYSSFEEARTEYEKIMKNILTPKKISKEKIKSKFLKDLIQKSNYSENLLNKHYNNRTKLSDNEYYKRKKYVSAILKIMLNNGKTTDKIYSRQDILTGKTFYLKERALQHKEILNELLDKYKDVPREGKVLFSGGLSGSGKTTILGKVNQDKYSFLDPDEIKEIMARKGMLPKIKGLTQMEAATLGHTEASYIAIMLHSQLTKEKKNIIFDMTMANEKSIEINMSAVKKNGYSKPDVIFVDVDPETSLKRVEKRHRLGLDSYTSEHLGEGGRFTPDELIMSQKTDNEEIKSKNSIIFSNLVKKGLFKKVLVFDNNNENKPIQKETARFIRTNTLI